MELPPRPVERPLSSTALLSVLLDVQSDIADALVYFNSLGEIFLLAGMALTGFGFLAWATNKKSSHRHQWGKRLLGIGILFTVIGFNFGGFLSLIYYVIGQ
jgi:hypothetical protein